MKRIKKMVKGVAGKAALVGSLVATGLVRAEGETLTLPNIGMDPATVIGEAAVSIGGVVKAAIGAMLAFVLVKVGWRYIQRMGK